MQRIIKNDQVVDESWHLLPKDATLDSLSNCDDYIVPLALWVEHSTALKARDGGLGVWLEAGEEIEEIVADLDSFQVIALNFPAFTDGRHYSTAALLRQRYGYTGELRAVGDVLHDQLFFMRRVGFDSYALKDGKNLPYAIEAAFKPFGDTYQGATDQAQPHFRRRA